MRTGSILWLLLAGCATVSPVRDAATEQRARQALQEACPRGVRLTQRAVVNAAGRQFSCDGIVQVAADGELRAALLSPVGVMAEVRVSPTGSVDVLKTARSFREAWARRYVATTAQWLFAPDEPALQFGRLADGRATLWREGPERTRWAYVFSADGTRWEELSVSRGWQRFYRAERNGDGGFHVTATGCDIDLRMVK
ncbi:MAG TPA: hypothetical protein VMV72_08205 [Verrucomicrobiae bacterium]|nr:hypothetical protein [Verrucomicrobiae bacterium]